MIGEGEPLQDIAGPGKLDKAKNAVQAAAQTVWQATQSVADAVERGVIGITVLHSLIYLSIQPATLTAAMPPAVRTFK